MIRQNRPQIPNWLEARWERWGQRDREKVALGKELDWYTHQYEKVNKKILPLLIVMTANHCSFCDSFPMNRIGNTVEHFRPKYKYPELSHQWENLFLCCSNCQEKNDRFHELLLKPDEIDYEFYEYFDYNFETGCLRPNPYNTVINQHRARITIILYGLNKFDRPDDRLRTKRQFDDSNNPIIDEFPYRFILQ